MKRPPQPDCYDYVRRYYGVPAYIGVRVIVGGRDGVIVPAKHLQHYVHIKLDGERRSGIYHPTDGVEYVVVGMPPSRWSVPKPAPAVVDASDPPAVHPGNLATRG